MNILIWGLLGSCAYLLLFGAFILKDRFDMKRKNLDKKDVAPVFLQAFFQSVLASFLFGALFGYLGYLNIIAPFAIVSQEFRQSQQQSNSFGMAAILSPLISIFIYFILARRQKSKKKGRKK